MNKFTDLKKQALISAKADISADETSLYEFVEVDENDSGLSFAAHQRALANYYTINIMRAIAIMITIVALVHFVFKDQPNTALAILVAFAAGLFYNIKKP